MVRAKAVAALLVAVLTAFFLTPLTANAATDELPNTPSKPTFSNIGLTSFQVNWTIPSGGNAWVSWAVEYSLDGTTWPVDGRVSCGGQSASACGTSMVTTGASEDTTYYVRVALVNFSSQKACADCSEGYSAWSPVATVTTRNSYTTVPTRLKLLRAAGPYNATVTWTEPNLNKRYNLLTYDVQYRQRGSGNWIDAGGDEYPVFEFGYILRLATTYEFRVRTRWVDENDDAQVGKWSGVGSFRTASSGPPSYILDGRTRMTGIKRSGGQITSFKINFTWARPDQTGGSPITKYEFRWRALGDAPWNIVNTKLDRSATVGGFTCAVDPLTGPRYLRYQVAIMAYNKNGAMPINVAAFSIKTTSILNKAKERCTVTQIY